MLLANPVTHPIDKNRRMRAKRGFTLLEAMVTMLILTIGFLGMAGVMVRTIQIQSVRDHLDNAVNLARSKSGQLAQVSLSVLATGSTTAEKEIYGGPNQEIVSIGPLNKKGEKDDGSTDGPFIYTTHFVICLDDALGGSSASGSNSVKACDDFSSGRPEELACDVGETDSGQAKIAVLTSFYDSHGVCHKVAFDQIAVDFN